jgi:hypothetical protein
MFQDLANAENLPPSEVTFLIRVLKKLLSLNIGRSSDAYSQVQGYVSGFGSSEQALLSFLQ